MTVVTKVAGTWCFRMTGPRWILLTCPNIFFFSQKESGIQLTEKSPWRSTRNLDRTTQFVSSAFFQVCALKYHFHEKMAPCWPGQQVLIGFKATLEAYNPALCKGIQFVWLFFIVFFFVLPAVTWAFGRRFVQEVANVFLSIEHIWSNFFQKEKPLNVWSLICAS